MIFHKLHYRTVSSWGDSPGLDIRLLKSGAVRVRETLPRMLLADKNLPRSKILHDRMPSKSEWKTFEVYVANSRLHFWREEEFMPVCDGPMWSINIETDKVRVKIGSNLGMPEGLGMLEEGLWKIAGLPDEL